MAAKKKIGKCELLSHSDKDLACSNADCESIKTLISSGMYLVESDGKFYHASCAKKLGIEFKVPLPKKRKRDD